MLKTGKHKLTGIFLLSILIAFAMSACSHTVKQTETMAAAGIQYADAMSALIDVTTDKVIEDNNMLLLKLQELNSNPDKLKGYLKRQNDAVKKQVDMLSSFHDNTIMLKQYFFNLQALAGSDAPERAVEATQALSSSINRANSTLRSSGDVVFGDTENQAVSKLAGMVVQGVQAGQIRRALERDAEIIGVQLVLHEKLLEKISAILKQSYQKRLIDLDKRVSKAYVKREIKNERKWGRNRKQLLKSSFFDQNLENAIVASKNMRAIWEEILKGNKDIGSMQLLLEDINAFTQTTLALKEAK